MIPVMALASTPYYAFLSSEIKFHGRTAHTGIQKDRNTDLLSGCVEASWWVDILPWPICTCAQLSPYSIHVELLVRALGRGQIQIPDDHQHSRCSKRPCSALGCGIEVRCQPRRHLGPGLGGLCQKPSTRQRSNPCKSNVYIIHSCFKRWLMLMFCMALMVSLEVLRFGTH